MIVPGFLRHQAVPVKFPSRRISERWILPGKEGRLSAQVRNLAGKYDRQGVRGAECAQVRQIRFKVPQRFGIGRAPVRHLLPPGE